MQEFKKCQKVGEIMAVLKMKKKREEKILKRGKGFKNQNIKLRERML